MFPPCQASSCLGSFCGRLAFIGKSVFGRFSVFLSSSGSAIIGALVNPFYAVRLYRYTAGNIGKQRNQLCYNEWQPVSAGWARNLSRPARIISVGYTELGKCASKLKR